jgi:hypothetical protein
MQNYHTIESLRKQGYKVRVIHRDWKGEDREFINTDRLAKDDNPCVTQIDVTTPDKKDVSGFAYRAEGDHYNRKIGNRIALNRAMNMLNKI